MTKKFIKEVEIFTRHMRDPQNAALPDGIESRRISLYSELIFNNIENLISKSFPVLRDITSGDDWNIIIRNFIKNHKSKTPYFPKAPLEFLKFLEKKQIGIKIPKFYLELAHYEWIEISLAQDMRELCFDNVDKDSSLLDGIPVVSPLTEALVYNWPVHRISSDFCPKVKPNELTYLVVYRDIFFDIGFIELNKVTARLFQKLQTNIKKNTRDIILNIAQELNHPNPDVILNGGQEIVQELKNRNVILGVKK
tara:strand:- start:2641 stop:3396 length:756 start_codon:yes stop_codon:yes gene_type:complete